MFKNLFQTIALANIAGAVREKGPAIIRRMSATSREQVANSLVGIASMLRAADVKEKAVAGKLAMLIETIEL